MIVPRIPAPAHGRWWQRHRDAGDLVVLTTATNRFLTELTAVHLGIEHLIATECEIDADGRFTGRSQRRAEHARRQGPAPAGLAGARSG